MRITNDMFGTNFWKYSSRSDLREYIIAFVAIGLTAGICHPLSHVIGTVSVGLILLMAVAVLALFLGRWPLLFAAILNALVWDYFFQKPLFNLGVVQIEDLFANIADLLVTVVLVILITRIRQSQTVLQNSQERLTILYNFLESMNDAKSISEVMQVAGENLKKHFGQEAVIYLKNKNSHSLSAVPYGNDSLHHTTGLKVAEILFLEASTGRTGETKTGPDGISYFPLLDPRETIGIIGIKLDTGLPSGKDKMMLFKSFITIIASTLGREISIETAMEKGLLDHSEKLFQAVLSSVSHELRTPIAIISAAVDNLNDERTSSEPEKRKQICNELESASIRLNNLVENILDMSRIESGLLKLNLQYCDMADLVGLVVKDMKGELNDHRLNIKMPESLPLIKADMSLIRQVLINILRNALMYTPQGTGIEITAANEQAEMVSLTIRDHGPGVPEEHLEHLFEKFYRVPGSRSGGTGLGLAIVRAFVEAHGGFICASNDVLGGLIIKLTFKAEK
ncbi:MAG: ATP-binding protein [Bacteroidetes bacterium]|nr:ATP-binding protein [Bacteroidota bacterium]